MLKIGYIKITDTFFLERSEESFRPFVDPDTFAAVLGYKNGKARKTKLLGESLVRHILACFFDIQRNDFSFIRTPQGKPYIIPSRDLYFNLSHSGDYIVCACSDKEVGVDIERIATARMQVARRFFHPEEIKMLDGLSGDRQDHCFFSYWAVKESFLKYKGTGLTKPLSSFFVEFASGGISLYEETLLPLYVRECLIDDRYKCFVCSEQDEIPEIIRIEELHIA